MMYHVVEPDWSERRHRTECVVGHQPEVHVTAATTPGVRHASQQPAAAARTTAADAEAAAAPTATKTTRPTASPTTPTDKPR